MVSDRGRIALSSYEFLIQRHVVQQYFCTFLFAVLLLGLRFSFVMSFHSSSQNTSLNMKSEEFIQKSLKSDEYFPTLSQDGQFLAYSSFGNYDCIISVLNAKDYKLVLSTDIGVCGAPIQPVWSPNDQFLAFTMFRTFSEFLSSRVFYLDIAHNVLHELPGPSNNSYPSWSPDSQRIAFHVASFGPTGIYVNGIYIMGLASSRTAVVTNVGADKPVWSPNGKFIAFDVGGNINVLEIKTLNVKQFENDSAAYPFAWSPNSQYIAFTRTTGRALELGLIDIPSGTSKQLTNMGGDFQFPSWSLDSQKLAFVSIVRRSTQTLSGISTINADGTNMRNIVAETNNNANYASPVWSSDARQILYVAEHSGALRIYVMNSDGSNSRLLDDLFGPIPTFVTRAATDH